MLGIQPLNGLVTWFTLSVHFCLLQLYLPSNSDQVEDIRMKDTSTILGSVPEVTLASKKEKYPMFMGTLCPRD